MKHIPNCHFDNLGCIVDNTAAALGPLGILTAVLLATAIAWAASNRA